MKINPKIYQKYGANAMILPPAPELEEELDVPSAPDEMSEKWIKLRQDSEGMIDPLTEKVDMSEDELLDNLTPSTIPPYEKELMDALHGTQMATPTATTVAPKKAYITPDGVLKLCSKYYDLCSKF